MATGVDGHGKAARRGVFSVSGEGAVKRIVSVCGVLIVTGLTLGFSGAYAQDAGGPFAPVPKEQRSRLEHRLKLMTAAYRDKDWAALFELISDENRTTNEGKPLTEAAFAQQMSGGFDAYRLVKFEPAHTVQVFGGNYDVYGCGEFPSGAAQPQRFVVAVREVREHDDWLFTTWDYPDPRQDCRTLQDPDWKPSANLRLDFLPQLTCILKICQI
jgi:hypothetical protein